MLHATQPIKRPGTVRYAWFGQFVGKDSVLCHISDCDVRTRPCCSSKILPKSGEPAHHACFPQVFPALIAYELQAHFGDKPAPLFGHTYGSISSSVHERCAEPGKTDTQDQEVDERLYESAEVGFDVPDWIREVSDGIESALMSGD